MRTRQNFSFDSLTPALLSPASAVILIDSDRERKRRLYKLLERLGTVVLAASNAHDALLICRQYRYGVALVVAPPDLPDTSLPVLAEQIAKHHPHCRLLALGGDPESTPVKALSAAYSPMDVGDVALLQQARGLLPRNSNEWGRT
jgi:DNA-binding NtrC family response regulator